MSHVKHIKYLSGLILWIFLLMGFCRTAAGMTADQAWAWYRMQPWLAGFNYVPSTAANTTEFWSEESFDVTTIQRELGWARGLGFNTCRVFVQYLVWKHDPEGLKQRFSRFLDLADACGISVMPVLFDDCAFGDPPQTEPYLGLQREPIPGMILPSWTPSPGLTSVENRSVWPDLENYVRDLVGAFAQDRRVLLWDLYNEPGNSGMGNRSLPLVEAAFGWARAANPSQPLTMAVWGAPAEISNRQLALSDVISFHYYGDANGLRSQIATYKVYGRPVINTEWMARLLGSRWATDFPLFKDEGVGCYSWGLVNGRTQCQFPWWSVRGSPEPAVWFHDLFHADGSPYDPAEHEVIRLTIQAPPPASLRTVNIVRNPGFELNGGSNGSVPSGWNLISNSFGVFNGFSAKDGGWMLHAGASFGNGGRYQDIPTLPGRAYRLEFWCVGFNAGAAMQRGRVQVGTPGPNVANLDQENNAEYVNQTVDVPKFTSISDWQRFTYTFTPTTLVTRLSLENVYMGANQSAVNMDLVSVTPLVDLTPAPLDSAAALWTFSHTVDWNGRESDFIASGNFTVANATRGLSPYLLNSDGYAAKEGLDASFGFLILGDQQELRTVATNGAVTLFVRTRRAAFKGNDNLVRVGETLAISSVSYSVELVNGNPVFCVWGTNQPAATLQYLGSALSTNAWYDLTGVFDPGQPGVADGKVTLYVFDLAARRYVGITETTGLPYETLTSWTNMILLFTEAPNNAHGNDNGAEMELAAVWGRALSATEVRALSAVKPMSTLISIF